MPKRTYSGAEYVANFFKKAGVRYVFGIPGHGNVSFLDAVRDMRPEVSVVPMKHEQWGGHMADGYFRANRKIPAVVTTSVGPGATNLATALATAFVDSSTFVAVTGQIQTYLFGMGIFQELERKHWVDYSSGMNHFVKNSWLVTSGAQLPRVLPNALKTAVSGRPGPVLIDLPMDVQVEKLEAEIQDTGRFIPAGRVSPDNDSIRKAARLLLGAERPLILIGGGVVMSDATQELVKLAEYVGAPVVSSFRGDAKGGFPEDHELYAFHPGNIGNAISNELTRKADVLLAVGVTFSDETTSSYMPGVTFNIPPTQLIQIDIDIHEIGKNYPTEIGIVSDAKVAVKALLGTVSSLSKKREYRGSAWFRRLTELRERWNQEVAELRASAPMGMSNLVRIMREKIPRETIVAVSAGLPQEILSQQWTCYYPRTFISSGGFSTMGFAFPAAIGAKLAQPQKPVVAVEGDGSFIMNNSELSTAVQLGIPVTVIVLNNYGWVSIRDLQIRSFKRRLLATEFRTKDGKLYSPDFEKIARAYGADYSRAERAEEVGKEVSKAVKSDHVTVVEVLVEKRFPKSGTRAYGYWDIPSPYKK